MVYVTWKLEHTPYTGTEYDTGNTTVLTDYYDCVMEANLGDGRDMFKFKIQNNRGVYDRFFNVKDKITVYRKVNGNTFTSDDIVMVAAVEKVPYKDTYNSNVLTIDCFNYSEAVMGAIVFVDAELLDPAEALEQAINNTQNFAPNFAVTWDTNNPSVKSDTTAFPDVGKRYFYVTLTKMLDELSTTQYTDDGRYFWYVNNENKLIWKKDSSFDTGGFDSSIDAYRELSTKIDSADVINYIIIKGGFLPNGKQIQDYVPDFSSIAKNGYKYHIMTSQNSTGAELVKLDLDAEATDTTDGYPDLSGSFTTQWLWTREDKNGNPTVIDGVSCSKNTKVTINLGSESANKRAYNNIVKEEVITRIRKEAQDLLDVRSKGKFIIEIDTLPGQLGWGLGDRITVNIPQIAQTGKELRVNEFQLTTDGDIYQLEEDTGSI